MLDKVKVNEKNQTKPSRHIETWRQRATGKFVCLFVLFVCFSESNRTICVFVFQRATGQFECLFFREQQDNLCLFFREQQDNLCVCFSESNRTICVCLFFREQQDNLCVCMFVFQFFREQQESLLVCLFVFQRATGKLV